MNRDPIEEHGGLNVYGYCLNNPKTLSDLLGLFFMPTTSEEVKNLMSGSGVYDDLRISDDYEWLYVEHSQNDEPIGCIIITPWKRSTLIQSNNNNTVLVSSEIIGDWKLVNEFPVIPRPNRYAVRGAAAPSFICGCKWQRIGCKKISTYSTTIQMEAFCRCNDGVRISDEKRTKDFTKLVRVVENDILCISSASNMIKVTFGMPMGKGCSCKYNVPTD